MMIVTLMMKILVLHQDQINQTQPQGKAGQACTQTKKACPSTMKM